MVIPVRIPVDLVDALVTAAAPPLRTRPTAQATPARRMAELTAASSRATPQPPTPGPRPTPEPTPPPDPFAPAAVAEVYARRLRVVLALQAEAEAAAAALYDRRSGGRS